MDNFSISVSLEVVVTQLFPHCLSLSLSLSKFDSSSLCVISRAGFPLNCLSSTSFKFRTLTSYFKIRFWEMHPIRLHFAPEPPTPTNLTLSRQNLLAKKTKVFGKRKKEGGKVSPFISEDLFCIPRINCYRSSIVEVCPTAFFSDSGFRSSGLLFSFFLSFPNRFFPTTFLIVGDKTPLTSLNKSPLFDLEKEKFFSKVRGRFLFPPRLFSVDKRCTMYV